MTLKAPSPSLALAAVFVLASCDASRAPRPAPKPEVTQAERASSNSAPAAPAPAKHGLRDAQLNDLMRRMSAKTQMYWPEDVPRPGDDQKAGQLERVAADTARLANDLSDAAERIPETIAHVQMGEADRAGLKAEAATLRLQAERLGRAAKAKKMQDIQVGLNAVSSTCISCHSRYRDFAGELEFQRVMLPGSITPAAEANAYLP